jgi:CheY-like chemotaxis protein
MNNLKGQRILVVEDEYFLADDLVQALAKVGALVVGPAATAPTALALLGSAAPDIAILDINLKDDISFAVADAMAEQNLPFVFATGYDESTIPERHAGRPRWQKPFDAEELLKALAELRRETSA